MIRQRHKQDGQSALRNLVFFPFDNADIVWPHHGHSLISLEEKLVLLLSPYCSTVPMIYNSWLSKWDGSSIRERYSFWEDWKMERVLGSSKLAERLAWRSIQSVSDAAIASEWQSVARCQMQLPCVPGLILTLHWQICAAFNGHWGDNMKT